MQHRYVFNIFAMKSTVRVSTKKKTVSLSSSMVGVLGSIYRNGKRKIFHLKKCNLDNVITFNFRSKTELIKISLTILIPVFWFIDFEPE